jgi:hypothetical protein
MNIIFNLTGGKYICEANKNNYSQICLILQDKSKSLKDKKIYLK